MLLHSISDTERGQFRVSFKMGSTLLPGTTTTISEMDSDRSGLMPSSFNSSGVSVSWSYHNVFVLATSPRVSILMLMKLWIL